MWKRSEDPLLSIDLGTVSDGEAAVLRIECAPAPDGSAEVRTNFVVVVNGRSLGGGASTNMFAPRNTVHFTRAGSDAFWMFGTVERECVSVTCDGRETPILRQPQMNRDFFLGKVQLAEAYEVVFTSATGEQLVWPLRP